MTWKAGFLRVAKTREIGTECYRVLFVVVAHVEVGSFSPISVREIADTLTMKPQSVHRALKILESHSIVKKRYAGSRLVGFEVVEFFGEVAPTLE